MCNVEGKLKSFLTCLSKDLKRFPGLSKIRVVSQCRFDLAFRLIEAVHLRQSNSIVESRGGKVGLQPNGNVEVIARFIETAGRSQHAGQIAMGLRIIRPDPNGLSKCRLGMRKISAFEPHTTQTVARFRKVRIQVHSLLEGVRSL